MTQTLKEINPENVGEKLKSWLRGVEEPDRVFTKNKKVEIVFLVEAVNVILPRTEGVEDITLFKIAGTEYEVPAILPEKLQAVARRRMLAYLRSYRDRNDEKMKEYLNKLAKIATFKTKKKGKETEVAVGFELAKKFLEPNEKWNCYIQPPGGDIKKTTDVGMDGFCPVCALFGVALDSNKISGIGDEAIGIKSRVEFDPAVAITDKTKSVAGYTHNKVSDGVSWTGQSLYKEPHVQPGTIFIGKVTLEDVTEPELKAFLATLSAIDRLGGRERIYGGVRIHLVGIRGGSYETVSAYEIARELVKEYGEKLPDVNEVVEKVQKIISKKGFLEINTENFKKLVDDDTVWDKLWESTVEYDKQVIARVLDLVKGKEKYTLAG